MIPTVKDIANLPVDKLPPLVHVPPVTRPFDVTIRPPGSKSLTNRALLLAALADGESVLTGALADADDAQVMVRALRQLGAEIEVTPEVEPNGESCGNATIRVKGVGGRWKIKPGETVALNLNNAGTATRFLTAAAVLQPQESGGIIIDGNARMRERPIGELVDALNNLTERGPRVSYTGEEGFPPVRVPRMSLEWISGMRQCFGPTQSSQFISAVLLLAPFLPHGLEIGFVANADILSVVRTELGDAFAEELGEVLGKPGNEPDVTSASYIHMTIALMRQLGIDVKGAPPGDVAVRKSRLQGFRYDVEGDASSATYPAAAALVVTGSCVRMKGISPSGRVGLQSDADFLEAISGGGVMGGELTRDGEGVSVRGVRPIAAMSSDMEHMPDTAMTMAVLNAFAPSGTELRGLRTLRVKETDRISALVTELAKVGVKVEPFAYTDNRGHADEGIRITPPPGGVDCSPSAPRLEFDTYDDHRMAMSLALIGLRRPNVYIRDPGCVRKTYPTIWRDLAKLYG